jgi:hypothetical protein
MAVSLSCSIAHSKTSIRVEVRAVVGSICGRRPSDICRVEASTRYRHLPARPISSAAGASVELNARRWRFGGAGPHVDLRSLTVYLSRQPIQH